jgi:16S rRNA (guanine527-N7)-methyltransferase
MTPSEQLQRGLDALGLALPESARERLLAYLALLLKWNRSVNLTAIRDEAQAVSHHLLDSLAVAPHLVAGRLADIGSGGGLPGIPLAIADPKRAVVLVETSQKKAAFLRQAVIELALANVQVESRRVETWQPGEGFPLVVSRAFAELGDFVRWAGHLLAPGGVMVAMKGVYPDEEIAGLPAGFRLGSALRLHVPGVDAARHLLFIEKT